MEIHYIAKARYENLAKNNQDGRYSDQLKWFNSMENWIKLMTTEQTPQKRNRDVLTEHGKVFLDQMQKKFIDEFKKSKKLEEQITKQLEQALEKSFSTLDKKLN